MKIWGKWLLCYQRYVGAFLSFRTVVHRTKTVSPHILAPRQTQQSVESDSNPSSSPDEDDRSYKRRKHTIRGKDQLSVHTSEDESVDVKLLTGHQSQQVTDQQQVDNSILKELSDLLDEGETTSPAIQKQLAEIADKRWGTRLTSDKIKKLTERYNRPENVSNTIPTKVNNEIWSQLSSSKKKMDLQLANLQQTICKVAITVLQTGDELLPKPNGETNKNLASRPVDALAMLGHANAEISRLRREQIRFALRPEYSYICKADIPNGPLLFGEDLPKQLKEAKETNAIGLRKSKLYNMDKRPSNYGLSNQHKGQKEDFRRGQNYPPKRKKPTMGNERK